jgi:uncharacterized membrane protein
VAAVVLGVVLRLWSLGHGTLSADESYSAVSAHLPFGQIWGHIAATDPHPPLSYLLLSPFAHLFTSNVGVRLPAAIFSCLAVVVLAWWQRDRGVAGLAATVLFAISPFALEFGRQARMYGLVSLASVVMVAAADRWLARGSTRAAVTASTAGFVIAMSYSAGVLMPVALALVPGWRRDRTAWTLRLAAAGAVGAWALLWLGHAVHWSHSSSGYPSLSGVWVRDILNATVAPVPSNEWWVLPLLALGFVVAWRRVPRDRPLFVALVVIPVAAVLLISLHNNIFLPKSLIMVVWAPSVLLGALVGAAWDLRPIAGAVVIACLAVLVLPYIRPALMTDEGAGAMVAAVAAARQPGDAIAMDPAQLGTLLDWYEAIARGRAVTADTQAIDAAVVYRFVGEHPTGRVWLVESEDRAVPGSLGEGTRSCGARRSIGGGYAMQCVELGSGG